MDLTFEKAVGLRLGVFLLRGVRKGIAIVAVQLMVAGEIVGGGRHGVIAKGFFDLRIGEAGADG